MKTTVILCCLWTLVQQVTAQTTYNGKGLVGSEVTLPCDYNQATDGIIISVTWTVIFGGSHVNLYIKSIELPGNQANPPSQYAGRVELVEDVKLKLTGVRLEDERQYKCSVTASINSETSNINLQVFAQPTIPVVQIHFEPHWPPDMSIIPLNTTVTFTCTSTEGRPPATLTWAVIDSGTQVSVNPKYTSSNDSQGVGDATSTFNFTTAEYGVTYVVQCVQVPEPRPIVEQRSAIITFTTEEEFEPIASTIATLTTQKGPTGETNCSGPAAGVVAGAAVGCFTGGLLLGGAAVFLFLRSRTAKNGGKKDVGRQYDADRQYENLPHPNQRVTSQRPGSGSDEYEVPMENVQPPTVPPPQSSDDYQELRPAIYQSLQRH